jgi:cysteine desulfurase/selenocysteine lyase
MPPYQGGGSMIANCTLLGTTFNDVPFRFEAGTPNVEGAIGLAAALDFFTQIPYAKIQAHKARMMKRATEGLLEIPGISIVGQAAHKGPVLSFNMKGAHHSDVGQILDQQGIAVRVGHHCTQPLMDRMKIPGTVRASFSIYNTMNDVEAFLNAMKKAQELFQ